MLKLVPAQVNHGGNKTPKNAEKPKVRTGNSNRESKSNGTPKTSNVMCSEPVVAPDSSHVLTKQAVSLATKEGEEDTVDEVVREEMPPPPNVDNQQPPAEVIQVDSPTGPKVRTAPFQEEILLK